MTSQGLASENQPENRRRRWILVGMIASLALNLFLAGVVGAWLVRPALFRPAAAPPVTLGLPADRLGERIARRLPPSDRPIIRDAFKNHEQEIRQRLEEWRNALQTSRRSLRADPFDPDAFTAAFNRAEDARNGYQRAVHQAVREAATAMSPEGRIKLTQPPPGRPG
jgi:uncharacterized membrane protein